MTIREQIYEQVSKLPESLQEEVLDFVQHLASRAAADLWSHDDLLTSNVSLAMAMRGMEDEDTPAYSIDDLKQVF